MTSFEEERRRAVLQFHPGAVLTHTTGRAGLVVADGAVALTRVYPPGTDAAVLWSAAYHALTRAMTVRLLKEKRR